MCDTEQELVCGGKIRQFDVTVTATSTWWNSHFPDYLYDVINICLHTQDENIDGTIHRGVLYSLRYLLAAGGMRYSQELDATQAVKGQNGFDAVAADRDDDNNTSWH